MLEFSKKGAFMKKPIVIAFSSLLLVVTGGFVFCDGLLFVGKVHAQAGAAQPKAPAARSRNACSLATLRGEYLFTGRGDAAGYEHSPTLPMVFAGVRTFNGQGQLSQVETISLGGKIRRLREEGVYTMDADCTGTMTIAGDRTFDIFVGREGAEGVAIRTTDGSVGTHTFNRTR